MKKILLFTLLVIPFWGQAQDPREYNHGVCMVRYIIEGDIRYYLTWSSSYNIPWEHDIYKSVIYFDDDGTLINSQPSVRYIGTGNDEAQEPVYAALNPVDTCLLTVWEDGSEQDSPNVRAQLHHPDGTIIKDNWLIAGGNGPQHSAVAAHIQNKFVIFYADEAPPSTGGAMLKAKIINDQDGAEIQSITFTPNDEDHWWPVAVSNLEQNRILVIWGNDGYAARGTVLYDNNGTIEAISPQQDYLVNIQQYYYQVEWLDEISRFLLIARNGAYDNMTDDSRICLIDPSGNITASAIVEGGIVREAKMATIWSECNSSYSVIFPSGTNDLIKISIDAEGNISDESTRISNHPDLEEIQWTNTGIWGSFVTDTEGNDNFDGQFVALFIMNDILSNDIVTIPVFLDASLFCDTVSINELDRESFSVYPNPASSVLYYPIRYRGFGYEIYSMEGCKLLWGELNANKINISELPGGVYILKINKDESRRKFYGKFIKE